MDGWNEVGFAALEQARPIFGSAQHGELPHDNWDRNEMHKGEVFTEFFQRIRYVRITDVTLSTDISVLFCIDCGCLRLLLVIRIAEVTN